MYTEAELTAVRAQEKRRWITLMIPVALMLAVLVVSLVVRIEWLTDVATLLAGVLLIFGWDMCIKPIHKYAKYIDAMLHGITHELDTEFDSFSPDISLVEGVRYYALTVTEYDEKGKPYDRLFYYDAEKALPSFTKGQPIRVTYHDRSVVAVCAQ